MPRNVSPGLRKARNTAAFACAPECGCTFACSAPNSSFTRVDRQLLDDVDDLAAAVVPLARQPFGVLVRERRTHRLEHGGRHEVLARDELEAVALPQRSPASIDARCRDRRPAAPDPADSGPMRVPVASLFRRGVALDLLDAPLVATAFEGRVEPRLAGSPSHHRSDTKRAGSTSTFASLCCRASAAISGVHATAARTCG